VSHYPARLIDIAPTALHVLGLTPPASMDGTILADALLSPEKRDQARQSALAPTLAAYQDALMQQSSDNMAEDVAKQIRPPGVEAARP
jgi:arylsulfatase A-like enzyme